MREGMLWYINDPKGELKTTVEKAVEFFQKKYGRVPLVCYVHPTALESEFVAKDAVKVLPNEMVIKNHIWLEFPQDVR